MKVIDGDTIDIQFENGFIERVRMLGVDTPETTPDKNKPREYDGIDDVTCLYPIGNESKGVHETTGRRAGYNRV